MSKLVQRYKYPNGSLRVGDLLWSAFWTVFAIVVAVALVAMVVNAPKMAARERYDRAHGIHKLCEANGRQPGQFVEKFDEHGENFGVECPDPARYDYFQGFVYRPRK